MITPACLDPGKLAASVGLGTAGFSRLLVAESRAMIIGSHDLVQGSQHRIVASRTLMRTDGG